MRITKHSITTDKKGIDVRLAVVSDLHSRPYKKVIEAVRSIKPDAILLPGDIVEIAAKYMNERNRNGLEFLRESATVAPTYYCYGNHEIYFSHAKGGNPHTPDPELEKTYLEKIRSYGVHVINDTYEQIKTANASDKADGLYVGGLVCGRDMDPTLDQKEPDLRFLSRYGHVSGYKILLCHYPHFYEKYLKNTDFDLVFSGHAHGGQWQIFGRGIYAPHQGLFPKYTHGLHNGRHIISRGAANNVAPIPRFFNPCEVLEIQIVSK